MTLHCSWRDMMRDAAQRLAAAGIENAPRDARLLLAHALNIAPVDVILRETDAIDPVALTQYEQLIQRRLQGEPVSRIRGQREFYGRTFRVTPDVLDPRPETELLVSEGVKRLPQNGRVLDLGTGSGCILVSVLAERPDATGLGLDISAAALAVAKGNAAALGVTDRASFVEGSWSIPPLEKGRPTSAKQKAGGDHLVPRLQYKETPTPILSLPKSDLPLAGGGALSSLFDLILSNPPYVAAAELDALAPDVRLYDPLIALTPGPHPEEAQAAPHPEPAEGSKDDGLGAYRAILGVVPRLLKPGASIGFEFGLGQAEAVCALMTNAGLTGLTVLNDLAGIPRAAFGRMPPP